jgi:N-acetylglucosamine kinase
VGAARGLERLHQWLHAEAAHSREITAAWEGGDPAAAQTIDLYLDLVSGPLAVILNTCAATIVPVGGGLATSVRLIAELDAQVKRRMLRPPVGPLLVATRLGGDAGLLGAALAADG